MIVFRKTTSLKDLDSVSLAEELRRFFKAEFPVAEMDRLNDAIQVASYLHRHDVRRGNRGKSPNPPYIEHPLRVAIRLIRYFNVRDEDALIAAILHDTVEDHSWAFSNFQGVPETDSPSKARATALQFISEHFGFSVASLVSTLSNPILPVGSSKEVKLAAYHDHLGTILSHDEKTRIVKFSDFVDNAGSLHHHYETTDPGAKYFVSRYLPLVPLYRESLTPSDVYESLFALARLDQVESVLLSFQSDS